MTTSIDYLEASRIEELTSQLSDEGYRVTVHPSGEDQGYDLVAEKDNRKVAVEVKFNARLRESAETIKALRRRALERGYDEFRLVVVSPPHKTNVHIEGLDKKLFEHLSENPPDALKNVPQSPCIESVRELEIDSISVTAEGTRVTGDGVVRIWERPTDGVYITNIPRSTLQWGTGLPFSFEIKLDNELRITDVYKIDVDTSQLV
jgi:REase_AHJR-like